ncbi:hypothetical protein BDQ94DRAFT_152629, partial [Aspergillus welwitschiae]
MVGDYPTRANHHRLCVGFVFPPRITTKVVLSKYSLRPPRIFILWSSQSIPNYGMEISLIYLLVVLLARKGCMPPPGVSTRCSCENGQTTLAHLKKEGL